MKFNKGLAKILVAILFLGAVTGFALYEFLSPKEYKIGHLYRGQTLPDEFEVGELVALSERANWLNTTQKVDVRIKDRVEEMILAAEKDGMCLVVTSGYRSPEKQYDLWSKSNYSDYIAPPMGSEHQTGFAVDLQACPMKDGNRDDSVERLELKNEFETLPEYRWLRESAWQWGFEESFTEENAKETGYPPEPWHWMFIEK